MIKRLMRGKLLIGFLREDISEVDTELGNGDFLGFFCLCNFCRDDELVQMFIHRSIQGRALMKSPLNPLGIWDYR